MRLLTHCQQSKEKMESQTFERIMALMKSQGITELEMEQKIGATRRSFSNWKRGKGRSYFEYIDKLADQLGVSIDYLVRGEDIKKDFLNHDEIILINNFRKLSPDEKKHIIENSSSWKK